MFGIDTGASGETVLSPLSPTPLPPAQNSVVVYTGAGDVGTPDDPIPKRYLFATGRSSLLLD